MMSMYAGGSPWFSEMGGGYGGQPPQWGGGYQTQNGGGDPWGGDPSQVQQRRPDQMMPRQFGGGGGFQSLAGALRMYGRGLGWQGASTKPMQVADPAPLGGAGGDVVGGVMPTQPAAAAQSAPAMSADNFGAGSAQNAGSMALAQATGNQSALQGAGSAGTNSAVNAVGPGSAGWDPQGVANAGVMGGPSSFRVPGFAAQAAQARGMTPQQYAAMQGNNGIAQSTTWDQVTM